MGSLSKKGGSGGGWKAGRGVDAVSDAALGASSSLTRDVPVRARCNPMAGHCSPYLDTRCQTGPKRDRLRALIKIYSKRYPIDRYGIADWRIVLGLRSRQAS